MKLDVCSLGFVLAFTLLTNPNQPVQAQTQAPGKTSGVGAVTMWTNGPFADPGFFPIAVWLQNPRNAPKFKAAGINLFVGLWRGPTVEQLSELEKAGLYVICAQNKTALENITNGGELEIMLKKLYGARFTTPSRLTVEIQPIGRGTTSAVYGLWASPCGSVRGSKYIR